jgi:hypothetical protein
MPMYRTVGQHVVNGKRFGGIVLKGERLDDTWDVSIFEVNGHRELSVRQAVQWSEAAEYENRFRLEAFPNEDVEDTPEEAAERHERSQKKSAKRATTMCRRVIKAEAFDEMLTLTYRDNQTDRDLCKKHFSIWSKRMKRALGEFRYCASFERQERGSMHVHIATHKLPSVATYKGRKGPAMKIKAWQLGTKIWRDIVGENNGLCFVGGATKFGGHRRNLSLAKMAAYVSKYIMKDFADAPGESNRYSRSNGTVLPEKTKIRLEHATLADVIATCFECGEGDVMVSHRVGYFKDSYWLCTEPKP